MANFKRPLNSNLSQYLLFFSLAWASIFYFKEDHKDTWLFAIFSVSGKAIMSEFLAIATWEGALYSKLADDEISDKAVIHVFSMIATILAFTGYNYLVKLSLVTLVLLFLLVINLFFSSLRSSTSDRMRYPHSSSTTPKHHSASYLPERRVNPRSNSAPGAELNTSLLASARQRSAGASQNPQAISMNTDQNQAQPQTPLFSRVNSGIRNEAWISEVPCNEYPDLTTMTTPPEEVLYNQSSEPERSASVSRIQEFENKAVQAGASRFLMVESSTSTSAYRSPVVREKTTRGTQMSPPMSTNTSSSDWELLEFKTRNGNIFKTVLFNKRLNISKAIDHASLYQEP